MASKVSKLDEQFKLDAPREKPKDGACSSIFTGVAIYVKGYTEPSVDELRRLMLLHGGQFHVYYSHSHTTHIIANNLPNSKIQELRDQKVVRPEWITDSIKAGHLLSYLQYQLYAKQKGLSFPSVSVHQGQEPAGPLHGRHLPSHSLNNHNPAPSLGQPLSRHHTPTSSHSHLHTDNLHPQPNHYNHFAMAASASRPLDLPSQSDFPPEKPLPIANPNPSPSPVCLNCSHHNVFPSNPTPLETNSLSANTFPSNPTPIETNSLSAETFPSNPTPLETNSLSANPIPSNYAPPHHDQQSAKVKTGGIISEFYSHSRLHHISTWRSEFSEYVNMLQSRMRATGGATFPGRDRLRRQRREGLSTAPGPQSCILHVDMDCFFVSVGIRHRPDLKGKSVAVTSNHGSGRVAQRPGVDRQLELQCYHKKYSYPAVSERKDGDLEEITSSETESHISHGNSVDQDTAALSMAEIASCSYEARQAGVRNGMFFGQAKQLCPSLQSVPYDFQAYKKVALAMYETLASYSHDIEALSCDEALVDSSALLAELSVTPDELASAIRADVRERTGCSASVGMGSNILLARMATRKAKPNGQYLLRSEEVDDFIRDQTVTSLPGVGRSMGGKLASLGVRSCGDLQQVSLQRLQKEFGPRTGQTLFRFCRGLDDRPVRSEKERKSVSAEMNYNIRFTQVDEAESFLTHLSVEVQKRLQGAGLRGRRLTLKVMVYSGHGTCDSLARSVTLAQLTDCGHLIASEVIKLFHTMRLKVQDLRGVGLQVQLLEGAHSVPKDPSGPKTCYVRDKLLAQRPPVSQDTCCMCVHVCLCPCQVDRSVLEALPAELRERVEHSWTHRDTEKTHNGSHQRPLHPGPSSPLSSCSSSPLPSSPPPPTAPPVGALVLQIPKQSGQTGSTGIILELSDFSQLCGNEYLCHSQLFATTVVVFLIVLNMWFCIFLSTFPPSDPMEEDILQVVKYCTDLINDKDLEKLDLIIKYMKRLMQQSVESVWSMAFDFILDNVQVVVQQTYGSTLKIT
uniref:DNA repair protein REV1 n=1 Tax=Oncorhynchus mykiss TaxID=8022 RepID=A0A8K9Y009_ONCMY